VHSLAPESCRVVEIPMPSAGIELKRIHEWYDIPPFFVGLCDIDTHDAGLFFLYNQLW